MPSRSLSAFLNSAVLLCFGKRSSVSKAVAMSVSSPETPLKVYLEKLRLYYSIASKALASVVESRLRP
jgi:hypothetical protein